LVFASDVQKAPLRFAGGVDVCNIRGLLQARFQDESGAADAVNGNLWNSWCMPLFRIEFPAKYVFLAFAFWRRCAKLNSLIARLRQWCSEVPLD
jgi:hypothetical protein